MSEVSIIAKICIDGANSRAYLLHGGSPVRTFSSHLQVLLGHGNFDQSPGQDRSAIAKTFWKAMA